MADLDVVVVGAGFAGIYAVHAFRSAGLSVRAFEAGSGIGGTWFWNRYPGARCDVEVSHCPLLLMNFELTVRPDKKTGQCPPCTRCLAAFGVPP